MTINEFQRLVDKVEKIKKELARATGMKDVLLTTLKNEFDCDTLEEGELLLKNLTNKMNSMEKEYQDRMSKFEEQWDDKI